MAITKLVLPVVVGAMSGVILISLGEWGIHHIYHLPAGVDLKDFNAVKEAAGHMPAGSFVLLLINYILCSFLAGSFATLVAGRKTPIPAVVVGIALTLAGLFNIITIPQPLWFCIISIICYLPMCYAGYLAAYNYVRPQDADTV